MNKDILLILEFEMIIMGILGCLGVAYYKTLKHILLSNCTSIKICGIECTKEALSDEILHDVIEHSSESA